MQNLFEAVDLRCPTKKTKCFESANKSNGKSGQATTFENNFLSYEELKKEGACEKLFLTSGEKLRFQKRVFCEAQTHKPSVKHRANKKRIFLNKQCDRVDRNNSAEFAEKWAKEKKKFLSYPVEFLHLRKKSTTLHKNAFLSTDEKRCDVLNLYRNQRETPVPANASCNESGIVLQMNKEGSEVIAEDQISNSSIIGEGKLEAVK